MLSIEIVSLGGIRLFPVRHLVISRMSSVMMYSLPPFFSTNANTSSGKEICIGRPGLLSFRVLHGLQIGWMLDREFAPPCASGIIWSITKSGELRPHRTQLLPRFSTISSHVATVSVPSVSQPALLARVLCIEMRCWIERGSVLKFASVRYLFLLSLYVLDNT